VRQNGENGENPCELQPIGSAGKVVVELLRVFRVPAEIVLEASHGLEELGEARVHEGARWRRGVREPST